MAAEVRVEGGRPYRSGGFLPIWTAMTPARARRRPASPMFFGLSLRCACVVALASATGFGATSSTQSPSATLVGTLSLTDPTAKSADPPVCTDALAPLDTDDCADVTFTSGATKVLDLGELSGSDVQAAALTWSVTTTNPTGYQVTMANAGAAPLLQGSAGSIPDMQESPLVPAASVAGGTHVGVAMGDPAADNQSAVSYAGSPWVTGGGQQGELFRGIGTTPFIIATRATPQTNDPFTATFAAAATAGAQPAPGEYAGTVRIIASALP